MIKTGGPAFLEKKLIWPTIPKMWLLTFFENVFNRDFLFGTNESEN